MQAIEKLYNQLIPYQLNNYSFLNSEYSYYLDPFIDYILLYRLVQDQPFQFNKDHQLKKQIKYLWMINSACFIIFPLKALCLDLPLSILRLTAILFLFPVLFYHSTFLEVLNILIINFAIAVNSILLPAVYILTGILYDALVLPVRVFTTLATDKEKISFKDYKTETDIKISSQSEKPSLHQKVQHVPDESLENTVTDKTQMIRDEAADDIQREFSFK